MTTEQLTRALRQAIDKGDHVAEVYLRQRIEREHERHGGDESPDNDCPVCQQTINDFIRYGWARHTFAP